MLSPQWWTCRHCYVAGPPVVPQLSRCGPVAGSMASASAPSADCPPWPTRRDFSSGSLPTSRDFSCPTTALVVSCRRPHDDGLASLPYTVSTRVFLLGGPVGTLSCRHTWRGFFRLALNLIIWLCPNLANQYPTDGQWACF